VAHTLLAWAWLCAALLSAPLARGQTPADEALHRRGLELRARGRTEEALAIFRGLYERTLEPRALARMALAEGALEQWVFAEEHLALALTSNDPWVREHRADLEQNLERLRANLGTVQIECPSEGAEVWIAQQSWGRLPLSRPLRVSVGEVDIELRLRGWNARQTVQVVAGVVPQRVRFSPIAPGTGSPSGASSLEDRLPRVIVDLGASVGLAVDPEVVTAHLLPSIRVNLSRRVGITLQARVWLASAPFDASVADPSAANDVVLMVRGNVALPDAGFAHEGWIPSVHFGVGYRPTLTHGPGHGNLHAGLRIERPLHWNFHLAGELTLQFMLPEFLFSADASVMLGVRF